LTAPASFEVVERMVAAAVRQDIPALLALVDPDVVWIPRRASTEGEYRGQAGYERFVADTFESFESFEPHFELRDLTEGRIFAWGTIHVRGRGSGAEAEVPTGGIFEIRGGRVALWHESGSKENALEALDPADLVRLVHDAFNRGDRDEFLALWHPDCTYHSAVHQLVEGEAAVFRGHDGIRRWWDDLHTHYEDLATKVLDVDDLGERVLAEFEVSGRGAGSGIATSQVLYQTATVRRGTIVAARDHPSREEALSSSL
jgi:ketosteroid isomerase-like protein